MRIDLLRQKQFLDTKTYCLQNIEERSRSEIWLIISKHGFIAFKTGYVMNKSTMKVIVVTKTLLNFAVSDKNTLYFCICYFNTLFER